MDVDHRHLHVTAGTRRDSSASGDSHAQDTYRQFRTLRDGPQTLKSLPRISETVTRLGVTACLPTHLRGAIHDPPSRRLLSCLHVVVLLPASGRVLSPSLSPPGYSGGNPGACGHLERNPPWPPGWRGPLFREGRQTKPSGNQAAKPNNMNTDPKTAISSDRKALSHPEQVLTNTISRQAKSSAVQQTQKGGTYE